LQIYATLEVESLATEKMGNGENGIRWYDRMIRNLATARTLTTTALLDFLTSQLLFIYSLTHSSI